MSVLAAVVAELSGRGSLARLAQALGRRREIAQLRSWDDSMLADIGLTRSAVEAALAAPLGDDPSRVLCELGGRAPRSAAALGVGAAEAGARRAGRARTAPPRLGSPRSGRSVRAA